MTEPLLIARNATTDLTLLPQMANRHGLITGATGTGKTVTLQTLAEHFSRIGVPCFMSDVKGDLSGISQAYMDSQGYTLTDAPMFTPSACEGTSTLFEVNYIDDQKAYLTQSGQLYIEATAMALGKVYTFGPTFRAEKSKTRRHLTEFWMLEPEAAYMVLEEYMEFAEALVCAIVAQVVQRRRTELGVLERDIAR